MEDGARMALPSTPARLVGERRDRLRARRVVAGPAHPKGAARAFQQRELSTVHLGFGRIIVLEREAPKRLETWQKADAGQCRAIVRPSPVCTPESIGAHTAVPSRGR